MVGQRYERCYVAFLDILGFKEKVMESVEKEAILRLLLDTLKLCGSIPTGGKIINTDGGGAERTMPVQSRFFSDSLCFFVREKQNDLAHLLLIIRHLQDRLWEKGICLRGGIVAGDMHWPEEVGNITLGPALIAAHLLESKVAIYPRIVISEELKAQAANFDAYPFGVREIPLARYIQTDADGVHYLDLLNESVTRTQGEYLHVVKDEFFCLTWDIHAPNSLGGVKESVRQVINENIGATDLRVRQKYAWLQSYLDRSEV